MLAHSDAAVEAWRPPDTLAAPPLEAPLVRSAVNTARVPTSFPFARRVTSRIAPRAAKA